MAEKLKVFIRVRPSLREQERDNFEHNAESHQFTLKDKIYTIDGILDASTQQRDVYHKVASNPINAFLQGFNTTIFAYGQTGSGKTHTIFGPDISYYVPSKSIVSSPIAKTSVNSDDIRSLFGIVPRSFITVIEKLRDSNHIKKYQMGLSCVEVYNVSLRDLLKPSNSDNLKIREDIKSKKFFVEKLTEETIESSQELMLFLKRIQSNRAVSSTNMNQASSRSHVLLQLHVIQQLLTGETKESLLTFVDLAGSEMARKTGAEGDRLKEAGYINSSLSTLSRCIEGLGLQHSDKKKIAPQHIPFRDSSLTKLLKVALGGNCKTTLVVCVSVEHRHKEETYSSLRFATRAACIKNEPVINKALDAEALYDENIRLKDKIERLENINNKDNKEWFQEKLKTLEGKEQEIVELRTIIDELELKMDKTTNHNVEQVSEFEEENVRLTQTINELEIELMRERHSKENYESRLVDLHMMYSEAASEVVFDNKDTSDKESTKQAILDVVNFRHSIKEIMSVNDGNTPFRDTLIKYMPDESIQDDDSANHSNDVVNPIQLIAVCKAMNDKIKSLQTEVDKDGLSMNNMVELNVIDIGWIDNDRCIDSTAINTTKSVVETQTSFELLSHDDYIMKKDIKVTVELNVIDIGSVDYDRYTPITTIKSAVKSQLSFEELASPDDHFVSDNDIDIKVETEENTEDSIPCNMETQTIQCVVNMETQTDIDDVEFAPLADTGCSIFNMFKCRS